MCEIVWKGYEVKGVDVGSGYQNELRTVETNSRWKGELKNESSSSDEKTESHYIFYESIQSEVNTSAYLLTRVSISGESTDHHHNQISLFTNNALFSKQLVKDERWISTLTSIRQSTIQSTLSIIQIIWSPFLSILSTCNFGRSITSITV